MPYGYHGRVLHVNLTTGSITVEEPDERFYRRYMGGSAMGLYYLLKNTPPGTVLDTLSVCQFVYGPDWQLFSMSQLTDLLRAVTGWPVTLFELQKLGERRLNMLRAFNAREGYGRDQDTIPKKLTRPLTGGKSDGLFVTVEEVERAKDIYYAMAGWDVATGMPERGKLEELGIGWVADELEAARLAESA